MIRKLPKVPKPHRIARLLQVLIVMLVPIFGYSTNAESATSYAIDTHGSLIRVYVYRAGLLSFVGHDHLVSTSVIKGKLIYTPPPSSDTRFSFVIPVATFEVDDPVQRKLAGGQFAGKVPADDRVGTLRNMLSKKVLDASQYPEIAVSGHWIEGSSSHGTVAVTIEVRNSHRGYQVPVDIHTQNDRLVVTGMVHLLQTQIGIAPLSIMGGMLKVADGVDVRFTLAFKPVEMKEQPRAQERIE